jgi:hypothetical protein
MASVYVETTIPSYLAARPSRNLLVAADQQVTHQWWDTAKDRYDLYVSDAVIAEILAGDPDFATARLGIVRGLSRLEIPNEVDVLAAFYDRALGLTGAPANDLIHVAAAVHYEIDYLVTWNCAHIANGAVIRKLVQVNQERRLWIPTIVTPQELLPTDGAGGAP